MHKFIFYFLISMSGFGFSQITSEPIDSNQLGKPFVKNDTSKSKKRYPLNPLVSSLLSTFVPGAGQIYNRKYWKAPVVWGGSILLYINYDAFSRKHSFYHQILIFKDRYTSNKYIIPFAEKYGNEFTDESAEFISELSKNEIQLRNDLAKKRRQQIIIGSLVFHLLQIVDATVDAHFYQFNVSEDLSLNISPAIFESAPYAQGIKLNLNF
tara:strand:- start:2328 stop:2957 length:630 start_codon:yes stop_codon:yes gene_type:complete